MSARYRLPLSDEQRQYLLELVQGDLKANRYQLEELLTHGHEMTTTVERDTEGAEAYVSRATGMSELLRVLPAEEDSMTLVEKSQHLPDDDKCEVTFHVEGSREGPLVDIDEQRDFDTFHEAEVFATDPNLLWHEVTIVCITRTVLSFKQRA
jgi:hypothetical protein